MGLLPLAVEDELAVFRNGLRFKRRNRLWGARLWGVGKATTEIESRRPLSAPCLRRDLSTGGGRLVGFEDTIGGYRLWRTGLPGYSLKLVLSDHGLGKE